jgi:predicted YcjX-like family ATPase
MAGDAGQHIDPGAGVERDVDLRGLDVDRAGDGQREGCAAKLGRVDAQEQMMHDRVADEDRVENVGAVDLAFLADLVDQAVDRFAHGNFVMPSRPSGFIIT